MRFYRPTIKQPISTFVEAPLDYIQGNLMQKQKDYDTADASLRAQGKLLDDIVVHDIYKAEKDKRVQQYQQELERATELLMNQGDVNQASQAFMKVQQQLAKDKFLKEAPLYSKTLWDAEEEVRKNKDNVASYNMFYNKWFNDYSKNWKNPDGSIKPANPGQLYEKNLDFQDRAKSMMADIKASGYLGDFDVYDPTQGVIRNTKTGKTSISSNRVLELAQLKAVDFLKTPEGTQFMRMVQERNPNINNEQMIKEGIRYLFTAGSNQIYSNITQGSGLNFVSDDVFNRQNTLVPDFKDGQAFQTLDLKNVVEGLTESIKGDMISSGLNKDNALMPSYSTKTIYKSFDKMPESTKNMLLTYLDSKGQGYDSLTERIKTGKATQEELKAVYTDFQKNFVPKLQLQLKSNVKEAPVNVKAENHAYTGLNSETFDVNLLKSGSGFLTANTKVFDIKNNKFIPLSEIEYSEGDKGTINKQFGPQSPFYIMSNRNKDFANPRQMVVYDKDGKEKAAYVIPHYNTEKPEAQAFAAIAENNLAYFQPNIKKKASNSKYEIKFVPSYTDENNNLMKLSDEQVNSVISSGTRVPGYYEIYNSKGEVVSTQPTVESATYFVENK